MGYSIDNGKAVIEPTSFSAMVTASPGSHVLHVKCWGQKVHDEFFSTSRCVGHFRRQTSRSPLRHAEQASHRRSRVSASARPAHQNRQSRWAIRIDNANAVIEPTSFSASVTATAGAHVLHVKCWGQQTSDQLLININVSSTAPAATPWFSVPSGTYSTKQTVSMAPPTCRLDDLLHDRRFRAYRQPPIAIPALLPLPSR